MGSSTKTKPINGRPTKYKPEYCAQLIEHMKEGYSFEAFAGLICVSIDSLYEWTKVHPDFSEAKSQGRGHGLLCDERVLRGLINGEIKGQLTGQIFKMRCRYREHGWREEDTNLGKEIQKVADKLIIKMSKTQE